MRRAPALRRVFPLPLPLPLPRALLMALVMGLALALGPILPGGATRADGPALLEDFRTLGFSAASPQMPEAARADRMVRLSGLPGALVLTEPIPWGAIEPAAPAGRRPVYRFEVLDALVKAWQAAGFTPVPVLTTGSPWACMAPESTDWARTVASALEPDLAAALLRDSRGATPPKPDRWTAWERFVEEVVERYDGDGILDMPGLARPMPYLQILDRVGDPSRWLGSAEEYLRLLHHADEGGHRASDRLRLVHGAVTFHGLGSAPFPDPTEWAARRRRFLQPYPEAARLEAARELDFPERTLEMTRLFQAVAVLGRPNLEDEEADLRWIRHVLASRGAAGVEIWLEESPARKLDAPAATPTGPPAPTPPAEELALRRRWLPAALSAAHSEHAIAHAWLARGVAFDLVRTAARARLAGAARTFLVAVSDPPRPEDLVVEPEAGGFERAPSWYAARQWIERTAGSREVGEVPAGSGARAVLFRFPSVAATPWLLVVLRDPNRSWAGDPTGKRLEDVVTLRVPPGSYRLEETALDEVEPVRREAEANGGLISVPLSPAPLYVIPVRVEGEPATR